MHLFAERLSVLASIQAEIAASASEGNDILRLVPIWAERLTGSDGAGVALLDGNELVYVAFSGIATPLQGIRVPRDSACVASVWILVSLSIAKIHRRIRVQIGWRPRRAVLAR